MKEYYEKVSQPVAKTFEVVEIYEDMSACHNHLGGTFSMDLLVAKNTM